MGTFKGAHKPEKQAMLYEQYKRAYSSNRRHLPYCKNITSKKDLFMYSDSPTHWERVKREHNGGLKRSIVFYPDCDPGNFSFPVKDRTVIINDDSPVSKNLAYIDQADQRIENVSKELIDQGAEGVLYIFSAFNHFRRYEPKHFAFGGVSNG